MIDITELKSKLIAIVGFGQKEGQATLRYLLKHGIKPVLFDHKPWQEWDKETKRLITEAGLNFIFGPDCLKELTGFDVIFRNPAVPALTPELVDIKNKGAVLTSQTQWFLEHCPSRVIGVTGTKGKGTTSSLIAKIFEDNVKLSDVKYSVYLTGNIGEAQALDFLDDLNLLDVVVFEMSSFQLQDVTISPHVAVVLMVTVEHMDYHKTVSEYHDAKKSITKFQKPEDFVVINKDYSGSLEVGSVGLGKRYYVSTKNSGGDADCFIRDGNIILIKSDEKNIICTTDELVLKGSHNWENVCAAILSANLAGASVEAIRQAVISFKGLEHRLEWVRNFNGVDFYDDSFSTTSETAIAAIKAFTSPEYVILGGSKKNANFTDLAKEVSNAENIKCVYTIGEEGPRLSALIKAAGFSRLLVEYIKTLPELVTEISNLATKGDVVLLSPACTSFDQFKNYKERGEVFKKTVLSLV